MKVIALLVALFVLANAQDIAEVVIKSCSG